MKPAMTVRPKQKTSSAGSIRKGQMSKEAKLVRGQLRQLAKELLPEALASEIHVAHYNQLMREVQGKLSVVQSQISETLARIDQRSLDMQSFLMRQATAEAPKSE